MAGTVMVLRHGTASGHGKVVEILAIVMVLLYMLTRLFKSSLVAPQRLSEFGGFL